MTKKSVSCSGVVSYRALGHVPLRLTTVFFECTLTYTKSDSDYISTVASYVHPVTFASLLASNPGDAT